MTRQIDIVVVTDNIRSLHNIGSIFRTSDGFGAEEIILVGQSGYPPEEKISKTAIGAENYVSWRYFGTNPEVLAYLNKNKYVIVAVEIAKNAITLPQIKLSTNKIAIILGSEAEGVDPFWLQNADLTTYIPMKGEKQSFNVASVASMVLYELQRNNL